MSQWKNIVPMVALSFATTLAGAGCMAEQPSSDEVASDPSATADGHEDTAEAAQTCGCFPENWFGPFHASLFNHFFFDKNPRFAGFTEGPCLLFPDPGAFAPGFGFGGCW